MVTEKNITLLSPDVQNSNLFDDQKTSKRIEETAADSTFQENGATHEAAPLFSGKERKSNGSAHQNGGQDPNNSSIEHDVEAEENNHFTAFSSRELKSIFCIAVANLSYGCIVGLFIPFFPTVAAARNIPHILIGGVFSVYALTMFLASWLGSKLIPYVGASRIFQIGLAMAGASTLAFGLADQIPDATGFIALCYVMRIIEAFGTGIFNTASYTIIANRFPRSVSLLVGMSETMTTIGIASGPAIGGGLYALGGYGLPFYVVGGTIILLTAFSCCVMPPVNGDGQKVQMWKFAAILVRSIEAVLNVVVIASMSIFWTATYPCLAPYADKTLGVTPGQLGLYYLLASGTYALLGPIWGRICDKLNNHYISMACFLLLGAVGIALLSPELALQMAPRKELVAAGLTMRQVFLGGTFIPTFGNLLRAGQAAGLPAGLATQAFLSSVLGAAFSAGNMVGPLLAGVINDSYGFPTVALWLSVSGLVLAALVAAQAVRRWRQIAQSSEKKPLLQNGADTRKSHDRP